jgi:hypothetical protein
MRTAKGECFYRPIFLDWRNRFAPDTPSSESWLKALRAMQGLKLHRTDEKLN